MPGRRAGMAGMQRFVVLALAVTWVLTAHPAAAGAAARGQDGVRTLYLIRHGLYEETDRRDPDRGKALVAAGREQARLTGQRLAAMPVTFSTIHASTMTRARQTAELIARRLSPLKPTLSRDLRECVPPSEHDLAMEGLPPGHAGACARQLENAFHRYFRPSPDRDSSEILVCHGNVIRYLTCRALGLDPRAWLRMDIMNCSISVIEIRADGVMRLVSFDDVGHLPPALQTFGGRAKRFPAKPVRR